MDNLLKLLNEFRKPTQSGQENVPSNAPLAIFCPFCLEQNSYQNSRDCTKCGREAPAAYLNEIKETRPLWVHTFGFTNHGKTVYLSMLLSFIERISYIWNEAYYRPLNDHALTYLQSCRSRIEKGEMPERTPISPDFPLPVLIQLKKMKPWSDRCIVMHDAAGETYRTIERTSESGRFINCARTSVFIVSLEEISRSGGRVSDLFDIYLSALERMGTIINGRNVVIAYTKADQINNLPKNICEYLIEDNLWSDISQRKRRNISAVEMQSYVDDMKFISNKLMDFTNNDIDLGSNLINAAESHGINLRFAVTSALGSPTDVNNNMTIPISPKRVLDPLFWILELDKTL